ncbi:MAG: hypothetical protein H8E55_00120 [Pelagibacterales bacterium]|nr:hypothetical protein [Pelagibacterales bacterium]
MKNIFLFISLLIFFNSFSQDIERGLLNKYRYVIFQNQESNHSKTQNLVESAFKSVGFIIVNNNKPKKLLDNPHLAIDVSTNDYTGAKEECQLFIKDWLGSNIYTGINHKTIWEGYGAVKKAISPIKNYNYLFEEPVIKSQNNVVVNGFKIDYTNEQTIKDYFIKKGLAVGIEGIWEFYDQNNPFRLLILKKDDIFEATVIEGSGIYRKGDIKAVIEPSSSGKILAIKWFGKDKESFIKTVGNITESDVIKFLLDNNESYLFRMYPKE